MKRFSIARIELITLLGLILSIASLIVGIVGILVSVNVSRGTTYTVVECSVKKGSPAQEVKVHADRGNLYWKLENTSSTKNEYKVQYKSRKNSTYQLVYSGDVSAHDQTFWCFSSSSNTATDRFYRVQQCNNLSTTVSHFNFYINVN